MLLFEQCWKSSLQKDYVPLYSINSVFMSVSLHSGQHCIFVICLLFNNRQDTKPGLFDTAMSNCNISVLLAFITNDDCRKASATFSILDPISSSELYPHSVPSPIYTLPQIHVTLLFLKLGSRRLWKNTRFLTFKSTEIIVLSFLSTHPNRNTRFIFHLPFLQ